MDKIEMNVKIISLPERGDSLASIQLSLNSTWLLLTIQF